MAKVEQQRIWQYKLHAYEWKYTHTKHESSQKLQDSHLFRIAIIVIACMNVLSFQLIH